MGNKIKTNDDTRGYLLSDLLKICYWIKANKLSINTMKTECMLIGTSSKIMKIDNLIAIRADGELIKPAKRQSILALSLTKT